ncbi:uncharacterized protein N0V89_001962 [Didymosphaeria variabile]|uniref:Uncharacterized protein n=1 Tax=Didymosphaeria variabile TaxID=1932322 RepID=A0A9W8XQT5_9PLEO|nr:uncharacterized protein N0V89_001962 [Didymosphaeria variabile]KAJ4357387.1 hypothetical protein N0V89_001962 [Didymosphaeria variabile]
MGRLMRGLKRKASDAGDEVPAKRVQRNSPTDDLDSEFEVDDYQPSDASDVESPNTPPAEEDILSEPTEQEIATRARANEKRHEATLKRFVDPTALKILKTISTISRMKYKRQLQQSLETVDREARKQDRRKLKTKFRAAVKKGFKVSIQPGQVYTFPLPQVDHAPKEPRDPEQPERLAKRRPEVLYNRDPQRAEAIKDALYPRRNGSVMAAIPRAFAAIARDPWMPDHLDLEDVKKPYDRLLYTRSLRCGQSYHRLPEEFTFDGVPKTKPSSSKYFSLNEDTHLATGKKRKQRADEDLDTVEGARRDRPIRSLAAAHSSPVSASSEPIATRSLPSAMSDTAEDQVSAPQSPVTTSLAPIPAPVQSPATTPVAPTGATQPTETEATHPGPRSRRRQRESDEDIPQSSNPKKIAKLTKLFARTEAVKHRNPSTTVSASMGPPAVRPDDSTRFKPSQPIKRPRPEEETDAQPAKRVRTSPVRQPEEDVETPYTWEPQNRVKTFSATQHEKRVKAALAEQRGKENIPVAQQEKQTKTGSVIKPVKQKTAQRLEKASQQPSKKRAQPEEDTSTRSSKRNKPATASSGPPENRYGLSENKFSKSRAPK